MLAVLATKGSTLRGNICLFDYLYDTSNLFTVNEIYCRLINLLSLNHFIYCQYIFYTSNIQHPKEYNILYVLYTFLFAMLFYKLFKYFNTKYIESIRITRESTFK
jgi:hypothetical protein